jgi:hypothetical protein
MLDAYRQTPSCHQPGETIVRLCIMAQLKSLRESPMFAPAYVGQKDGATRIS